MNTETVNDFAAFEASANSGEPVTIDNDTGKTVETKPEDETPLDLTPDDEAVDVDEGEDGGEEHQDADGKRRRSKPASQRIAELTARLRETERELEATRNPRPAAEVKPFEKPNPEDFEFGESDPDYIDKLTDWKLDTRDAERNKANEANQSRQEMLDKINTGVAKAEEAAKAKYEDFDDKIAEAVDARGGEPLPPLLTIGIGVSPVGGDILYRLATDEAASKRLEKLAKGGLETSNAMAMALGELEGEYLGDTDDADLDMSDTLDMARMMGRMRARLKGAKAAPAKVAVTNAPEPPRHSARGGSGQFTVDGSTSDFASFEKMANGKR